MMNLLDADFFRSPGSVLAVLVTVAVLFHRAWRRVSQQKQTTTVINSLEEDKGVLVSPNLSVSKEPEVPEGWWTSREVFELERRALFSQSWIYLAHSAQFSKPGAYQSFDVAGFPLFLIRGKDSQIRAFHNVCRHRAYTITRKETGASTVLGCKYHGWSYDTYGRLVKAPQFDDVPGFDKSENSLFEIHAQTTDHGWIFVNLNATEPAAFSASIMSGLEAFAGSAGVGSTSTWITGRTLTGAFNWKLGTRPRYFAGVTADLEQQVSTVLVPSLTTKLLRMVLPNKAQDNCLLFPSSQLYSFENTDLWLSLTFLPASEISTQVRYDLFDNSPNAATYGSAVATAVERVIQNLVQRMESDFPSISGKPGDNTQSTRQILSHLQEHAKLEKTRGELIVPATRQPKASSLFQRAEQLCKEIDCASPGLHGSRDSAPGNLDW